MVTTLDIIAIAAVIGLVLIELLPEKPQRFLWGILLTTFGILPLLNMYNVFGYDIYSYNMTGFIALFIAIVCGELLFTEGLKEQNNYLKLVSVIFGLVIILITSIDWMQDFNALSFQLPPYSPAINFAIYMVAGVLTIIGASKAGA